MPVPEPASPPSAPGLLAGYHRALPRLAVLLRAAGLPMGPDRWQNVYDLLVALNARGRLPARPAELAPLIAPLLCRSAQEQAQFDSLFAGWLADLAPEHRGAPAETAPASAAPAEAPPPALPRLRWWLLGLALLLAVLSSGLYWYHYAHQPLPAELPAQPEPIPPPSRPPPEPPPTAELALEPIAPRTPPERPALDPVYRAWLTTLGDLVLLVPGFFALGWLLLRWLTWKTVLERRQGDPDDPLTAIGLDPRADDLLDAPALRRTLRRLHTPVAVPTRRLDADATVARTARHAGLFQPVRRTRRRVPEVVVLVEQRHAGDQMAGLAGQFVERLQAAGLCVQRYAYRDSPERLIGRDGRWRPLREVTARHAGARLLLVGEPAALIDPLAEAPLPWAEALAPWPERGLLVTRRPPARWELALAAAGFLIAELDSAGVQTLVLRLSEGRAVADTASPALTEPLPRALQDARRWTQPLAPARAEQSELLAVLDAYLGTEGARLLAAMAAYPQLHWGLTRLLDLSLFPTSDAVTRERRLLKVARLPWSRGGWLPDWLRAALLGRLGRAEARAIRALYRALLQRESTPGAGRLALPVTLPRAVGPWAGLWAWVRRRGWRLSGWLSAARTLSAEHGALNDAIFADVLFGWRVRPLDFVLPRGLLRRHLGGALGQALAPRLLLAGLIALGGAWLAERAWNAGGQDAAQAGLLGMQNAAHAGYAVTLWQREETARLARALVAALQADGFTVKIASSPLALPDGAAGPLPSVNKIQWGDENDVPMAEHIAERLRYLTWGDDPEVTNRLVALAALADLAQPPERRHLRVLLLTPGATGSAFADPLAHTLTAEQTAALLAPPEPPPASAAPEPELPAQPDAPEKPQPPLTADVAPTDAAPQEPQPQAPRAEPRPAASAADADTAGQLQTRIDALDERWTALRREMELEETGAGDRLPGRGPKWEKLNEELGVVIAERNALARALRERLGQTFSDALEAGGTGPEMVPLAGGRFQMGSPDTEPERASDEGPRHWVSVPPFAIGRTEVSFADYDRFAAATGREKPFPSDRGQRPVINVSWNDARAYTDWLSAQTGQQYRLPTEAEWEYAARAGTETPFWTGDCIHTDQANYDGNVDYNGCGAETGVDRARTVPTGSLPANAFGLHEVAGNVWEWVEDCWHDSYAGAPADGSAWLEGGGGDCARRVLRGGGWGNLPRLLRSAYRNRDSADVALYNVGIRLARTP
jgi:formylglycine-generating enzyme required for sulfatase activity